MTGEVWANRRAFGLAATRLSREARPSFRRPSMATEIGSPPIHGPLPRFPLAVEPPHQDLTAPRLRRTSRSKATQRAGTTARASTSTAVAMTLAGPALSGLDGTLSIGGIALHLPWKGRDGLRAGSRVSCDCG